MKKVEFLTLLYNEMIRLGATPDVAEHHSRVINQTFTPEDIARVLLDLDHRANLQRRGGIW